MLPYWEMKPTFEIIGNDRDRDADQLIARHRRRDDLGEKE
jgi:hypothetical protein